MYRETFERVHETLNRAPRFFPQMIHLLSIARMLERIADHAVNIAEDVIYLKKGEIQRHRRVLQAEGRAGSAGDPNSSCSKTSSHARRQHDMSKNGLLCGGVGSMSWRLSEPLPQAMICVPLDAGPHVLSELTFGDWC